MTVLPISQKGFDRLMAELEQLKAERPEISRTIQEAREEGDLSENASYDAARERQGMNEARISYLESRLANMNVVDLSKLGGGKVTYGSTVKLVDLDTEQERKYTILNPEELDLVNGGISVLSPVARALLGKSVGDDIIVDAPRGKINYEIAGLEFNGDKIFS